MTDTHPAASTRIARVIRASRDALCRALTEPEALAVWLSPEGITGKVHEFDGRIGGGYRMSLFYPETEKEYCGTTAERKNRYSARYSSS